MSKDVSVKRYEIDRTDDGKYIIGRTESDQPLVASPTDGQLSATDIMQDTGSVEPIIPFASARTKFHARDADDKKKWKRFWMHQHGWVNDHTGRRTYRDKICRSEALSDAFGLSDYQKARVIRIVGTTNGRRFNQIGGVDALALGAISYVVEQDIESTEDFDRRIVGSDQFKQICDQHDVDGWDACRKMKEIQREIRNE